MSKCALAARHSYDAVGIPSARTKERQQSIMKYVLIAIIYHRCYGHTRRQAEAVKTDVEQVKGPDLAPPESDLRTAEHLDRRVAEAALQFARGRLIARQETI